MIELLKVYETLYLNDQQKILFKLIIKSKFSNNFFKSVRQAYLEVVFCWNKTPAQRIKQKREAKAIDKGS